ncbi:MULTISPECIES: DUF2790 domain-containing protein [unclassified Pseudomonas]|uniref:DUF2790 domain-containing protein n=1 Tax=Pseudomonas TaxID=286 RepID=UPI0005961DFA|nr:MULTISPECIES: DUF2790 domain-containing protein [unclassified Pseudomonas]MBD0684785.1 DUF2790 domain-containing protein [Pseudomonas sp. PSB18]
MKLSKWAFLLVLGSIGVQAYADDSSAMAEADDGAVEIYNYSTSLDIKRVISISDTGDTCGPVPQQMTYEDSHGQRHVLQYQVIGSGCSNG